MGIPQAEMVKAGQIMATKLVSNEFVAMLDLGKVAGDLSARTVGILSVFCIICELLINRNYRRCNERYR